MLNIRRAFALLAVGFVGFSILGLFVARAPGQRIEQPFQPKGKVPPPSSGTAANHSSVKITEDSRFRQVLSVGRDCIKDEEFKQAVEALQAILNEKKDYYVQVRESDVTNPQKDIVRWTSVKFEANNLIGTMKLQGLETYEAMHGAEAKAKLDEAKKNGDQELLADVAQRFCHTEAGIEANEILATLQLARGQVFTSALRFEKILAMNPEHAKVKDVTLFKAAVAFRRVGDNKNFDSTWKRLQDNLQGKPLKVGTELFPVAKLETVINETPPIIAGNVHDWPMQGGNNLRTAQAIGSPPLMDNPLWRRPVFNDVLDGFKDEDPDQAAKQHVDAAIKQVNDQNMPVLPGFFPIASQGIMVYRSHRDIRAVALKELEVKDEESGQVTKIKPGQLVWKSIPLNRSLALLLEKNNTRGKTEQWLTSFMQVPGFASFLYDNTLAGSLATDHRLVYGINDLAVPPHPQIFQPFAWNQPQWNPQEMKPLLMQNELYAYDLLTGKLKWDLNQDDPMFKDSHFLSMPISVGGKLYVLNEKLINPNEGAGGGPFGQPGNPIGGESELRLVCIDPNKLTPSNKPVIVGDPQPLGNIVQYNRMVQDIPRRMNAVHLAFGEGVLVCPTNAGEVFGIDLMTRSLVWSYPYREHPYQQIALPGMPAQPNPFPNPKNPGQFGTTTTISKWKTTPPAIQDGKVVFTAPDADSVHCVSLRDGKPVWRRSQAEGDLYMAGVFKGRVVIVGKNHVRALSLKDGSQVWSIHMGDMPSGQGVASKDIYYLPLKKGEILAIDIERGQVKAHNRAAVQGAAPGNLVFYEGMVLSQTTHEVMAYPQLTARLDIAKAETAKEPENMTKLTDYGELLLKDGQVSLAVESLLKVYNNKPAEALSKRVNERLFEALTDLMQVDFETASKAHLTVYDALTKVPGNEPEEQARKAKFYRLVGQGREGQGRLVEAFDMYKKFGALPSHKDTGIPSIEDPSIKTPVNVWLRGRISGMLTKATPEQKAPLETKIAQDWEKVNASNDIDTIRSFVGMFDTPFKVGREARVRLAETIMDRNNRTDFLEAELYLHQVLGSDFRTDPSTGGRALAALALLEEKKGSIESMKLAAEYYRQLDRDFGKVAVRGTKTGSDLLNKLAADKRFLPFLEETTRSWGPVKLAARDLGAGAFNAGLPGFVMQPDGDQTPFARQNRLLLDPSDATNPKVRLRDLGTNQDRWTANLGHQPMNAQIFFQLYQQANPNQAYHPNARFRFYQVKGHLIVCQVGVMVYCIDGDSGKKLWELQTVDNIQNNGLIHLQQTLTDEEGNPEFLFWNQLTNQRFRVALGRIGAAQASYVAVLGYKGLTVVDPLKGTTLWKSNNVPMNSHVFGDDQYLFIADANPGGGVGAGKTLRATDGEVMNVPDFSPAYAGRIKVLGRQILSAHSDRKEYTLRLYDIVAGKDKWSKAFPAGSFVLQSEDDNVTAVIDPKGALTVIDVPTGKEVLTSNLIQGRIAAADLQGLKNPFILQDSERFYIALNKPVDNTKIGNGLVLNNFNNGTRCQIVNGWFLAVHRNDGERKVGDKVTAWKKGDVWHVDNPIKNQMLVVEQFEQSPILLFTARYNEILGNGGNRWVSVTQSYSKSTLKWIHDSGPRGINGFSPMFFAFQVDHKTRTVNLIGFSGAVQHYVDDGKGPPPAPQGAMLQPGDAGAPPVGFGGPNGFGGMAPPPIGFQPPNGFQPGMFPPNGGIMPAPGGIGQPALPNVIVNPNIRIMRRVLEVPPPIELPANPNRDK